MPDFGLESLFALLPQLQGSQIPSLSQIINQPVTPGFNPQAGGIFPQQQQQQPNPYEALLSILNNLQNQPIAQAPQPSRFQSILNAIGGGAAVLGAKDPSAVLQQQLGQRNQERLIKEQQIQERQRMIDQARLQIGIQQATDLAREQADVRRSQREDLREETKFQRNRVAAIEDLKKSGIVNMELAEMEQIRSMDFWNKNKDILLSQAEDKAYIQSLPERDKQSLGLATEWKFLDPSSDSVMLNNLAKKVIRGRAQLSSIERQLYNRLEDLRAKEDAENKEEAKLLKKAQRENIEAVTEATKTGQRYAGQQDRYANAFAQQQGAEASRVTSDIFMRNSKGIIMDSDKVKTLPTLEQLDFQVLPEDEQIKQRAKVFSENAARNRRIQVVENPTAAPIFDATKQQTAPQPTVTSEDDYLLLDNLKKQGMTKEQLRQTILTSNWSEEDKKRGLQYIETGRKEGTIAGKNLRIPYLDTALDVIYGGGAKDQAELEAEKKRRLEQRKKILERKK